jgi:hypothetical protein
MILALASASGHCAAGIKSHVTWGALKFKIARIAELSLNCCWHHLVYNSELSHMPKVFVKNQPHNATIHIVIDLSDPEIQWDKSIFFV